MYRYRTIFHLTDSVSSTYSADEFVRSCSFSSIRKVDLAEKIISLRWGMSDDDTGYAELVAKEPLTKEDMDYLSPYIRNELSNGAISNLKNKSFANYDSVMNGWYNPTVNDPDYVESARVYARISIRDRYMFVLQQ